MSQLERSRRWHQSRALPNPLMWVYEMWTTDGRCLYVGKTTSLYRRRDHYRSCPDTAAGRAYHECNYMVLNMATDPEAERIQKLKPEYNTRLNGDA